MKFKVGDRVVIKRTKEKGAIVAAHRGVHVYTVQMDKGDIKYALCREESLRKI